MAGIQQFTSPDKPGQFAVGDKPTAPPVRMCTLGGLQFPEPLRAAAAEDRVWVAGITGAFYARHHCTEQSMQLLADGFLHATEAAAMQHSAALRGANLEAIKP
ncbi:MAG: hypothetical protein EOO54_03710 [Haliea sp.]|nr:MAG: hypothetical protein EOO54_03710 [Haliea sp.]